MYQLKRQKYRKISYVRSCYVRILLLPLHLNRPHKKWKFNFTLGLGTIVHIRTQCLSFAFKLANGHSIMLSAPVLVRKNAFKLLGYLTYEKLFCLWSRKCQVPDFSSSCYYVRSPPSLMNSWESLREEYNYMQVARQAFLASVINVFLLWWWPWGVMWHHRSPIHIELKNWFSKGFCYPYAGGFPIQNVADLVRFPKSPFFWVKSFLSSVRSFFELSYIVSELLDGFLVYLGLR